MLWYVCMYVYMDGWVYVPSFILGLITPFQGKYSEVLPTQARSKRTVYNCVRKCPKEEAW